MRFVLRAVVRRAFSAVAATAFLGPALKLAAASDPSTHGLREYADLLQTSRAWYAEELSPELLVYPSIHGMLEALDPHTSFFEPAEYGSLQEKQRGSYFGLGIVISQRDGAIVVISTSEGSSAARLGLRPGDMIVRIEGEATDSFSTEAVADRLRGPKGTKVRLTIVRPGLSQPLEMTATRDEIPTNSVTYAFLLSPGVGYIRLKDFTQTSEREFLDAWDRLARLGMKQLIFDLRGNGGGLLDAALEIADSFLERGQKIVLTKGRSASSEQVFYARGAVARARIPVVILVNKGSASGSEIVAGAIQDHDRGLIVGQTTWGKGLVQSVFNLSDGAGLAVTSARYYTPSGRSIQRDYSEPLEYYTPVDEDGIGDEDEGEEEGPSAPATSDLRVFRTDTGRPVRGGGGITPDVRVAATPVSPSMALLYARGRFFEFAVAFRTQHRVVPKDLRISQAVRQDFVAFVERLGTPSEAVAALDAERKDRDSLDRAILEEILNNAHGAEAGYRTLLTGDAQLQKAVTLLPEAERLAAKGAAAHARLVQRGGGLP